MASRMMHLAIAQRILQQADIPGRERFLLGSLLPDALRYGPSSRGQSHLLKLIDDGKKHTYDLSWFRERWGQLLTKDGLYLGYYLHLVQDIHFRRMMCMTHTWQPSSPAYVQQLHQDYRQLNVRIARAYGLQAASVKAMDLSNEPISELYPFDLEGMLTALQEDFVQRKQEPLLLFTQEMAERYIAEALELSTRELSAVQTGKGYLNQEALAWPAQGRIIQ